MNNMVWRSAWAGGALALIGLALLTQVPSRTTSQAQAPAMVQVVAADVDYAANERSLVTNAQMIIIGTPTDAGRAVVENEGSIIAAYYQTIQVEQVLKGTAPGPTIQLVRAGTVQTDQATIVKHTDELAGPLAQERHILFLSPSAEPGVLMIVGHTSGALPLSKEGRVTHTRPEIKGFEGLTIAAVHGRIRELDANK